MRVGVFDAPQSVPGNNSAVDTAKAERRVALRSSPLVSGVVAAAVVGGGVLFSSYWNLEAFPRLVLHWTQVSRDVLVLIAVLTPYLPFALVLAIWGIDARHRVAGFVCALLAGVPTWLAQEALMWSYDHGHMTQASLRFVAWIVELSVPTLLALAWGLARRRGRTWILGVAVAPVLAAVHHALFLHSVRWQTWEMRHAQGWGQQLLFVAPAIVAALAGWAIEAATRSSPRSAAPASAEAAPTF